MAYDITCFTTNRMLLELAVAKQFGKFDVGEPGDNRSFVAQALHDAIPISADEHARFMGEVEVARWQLVDGSYVMDLDLETNPFLGTNPNAGKFIVKARIVADENELRLDADENPHAGLPNPCSITEASDFNKALSYIILHTTFVTSEEFEIADNATISKDDLINVTLTVNENGNIDLESGTADSIRKKASTARTFSARSINCETLASLFDEPIAAVGDLGSHIHVDPDLYDTGDSISSDPTAAGSFTSRFGRRMHPIHREMRDHNGVDIAAPTGTDVYAVTNGVVTHRRTDPSTGYGLQIQLVHGNPNGGTTPLTTGVGSVVSRYAHLSEFVAADGATVAKGEVIGKVGSTGDSTGPHLHYEIRVRGSDGTWAFVDPERYTRENPD